MRPSKLEYVIAKVLYYLLIALLISPFITLIGIYATPFTSWFTETGKLLRAFLTGLACLGIALGIMTVVGLLFMLVFALFSWVEATIENYHKYSYYDEE